MANKMKDFLPKIEMEKMRTLLETEEKYETGQITLEEARDVMRTKVGTIRPYHIAYMEQNLKAGDDDECIRVDMRKVMELLDGFMDNSRPELPADHPLSHYYKENDEMRRLMLAVEDLVQYPLNSMTRYAVTLFITNASRTSSIRCWNRRDLTGLLRRCGISTISSGMKSGRLQSCWRKVRKSGSSLRSRCLWPMSAT